MGLALTFLAVRPECGSCNGTLALSHGHEKMYRHTYSNVVLKLVSGSPLFNLTI